MWRYPPLRQPPLPLGPPFAPQPSAISARSGWARSTWPWCGGHPLADRPPCSPAPPPRLAAPRSHPSSSTSSSSGSCPASRRWLYSLSPGPPAPGPMSWRSPGVTTSSDRHRSWRSAPAASARPSLAQQPHLRPRSTPPATTLAHPCISTIPISCLACLACPPMMWSTPPATTLPLPCI